MAKFISVLTSDVPNSPWIAVQWGDTLAGILANKYYTAGINLSIPKNGNEVLHQAVTITEIFTQTKATANVYQLSPSVANFIRLSGTKSTKRFAKSINKLINENKKVSF